jgi:hypothetical protein
MMVEALLICIFREVTNLTTLWGIFTPVDPELTRREAKSQESLLHL